MAEDDGTKGVEMAEDFEGDMHDLGAPEDDRLDDGEREEGDEERMEQQVLH
jgi:hypothetical protein